MDALANMVCYIDDFVVFSEVSIVIAGLVESDKSTRVAFLEAVR